MIADIKFIFSTLARVFIIIMLILIMATSVGVAKNYLTTYGNYLCNCEVKEKYNLGK